MQEQRSKGNNQSNENSLGKGVSDYGSQWQGDSDFDILRACLMLDCFPDPSAVFQVTAAKLLISDAQVGTILGAKSTQTSLKYLQNQFGVCLSISDPGGYFPGTLDRILVLCGYVTKIYDCLHYIIEKLKRAAFSSVADVFAHSTVVSNSFLELAVGENRKIHLGNEGVGTNLEAAFCVSLKMLVPNSSVGSIMGLGGRDIRKLAVKTGVHIQISTRIQGLLERVVSVNGTSEQLECALQYVVQQIRSDPHVLEHATVLYYPVISFSSIQAAHAATNTSQGMKSELATEKDILSIQTIASTNSNELARRKGTMPESHSYIAGSNISPYCVQNIGEGIPKLDEFIATIASLPPIAPLPPAPEPPKVDTQAILSALISIAPFTQTTRSAEIIKAPAAAAAAALVIGSSLKSADTSAGSSSERSAKQCENETSSQRNIQKITNEFPTGKPERSVREGLELDTEEAELTRLLLHLISTRD